MRYIDRLRLSALRSCRWRGHDMRRFRHRRSHMWSEPYGYLADSECKRCGMTVHLDTHPAPNGIDIGGEAVALDCGSTPI